MQHTGKDELDAERLSHLIFEAKAGKWEAFGELVRHYQLPLRVYAARLGLRGESVHDVTQEAFVRALESLGRYDPSLPFLAWLAGITRHIYLQDLDRRAREGKARSGALAEYLVSREPDAPATSENLNQRLTALKGCMDKLTATARRMVDLRFRDELDLREIAKQIGTESVGSVSKTLFRIRRQLADCVRLSWKGV
jgi:RNA polymerase sigma-70 factor (ECF subfamily)